MEVVKKDPGSLMSKISLWGLGHKWRHIKNDLEHVLNKEAEADSCRYQTGFVGGILKGLGLAVFSPFIFCLSLFIHLVLFGVAFMTGYYLKIDHDADFWDDPFLVDVEHPKKIFGLHFKDFVIRPIYILFLIGYGFFLSGAPEVAGVAYGSMAFWSMLANFGIVSLVSVTIFFVLVVLNYFTKDRSEGAIEDPVDNAPERVRGILRKIKERSCRKIEWEAK